MIVVASVRCLLLLLPLLLLALQVRSGSTVIYIVTHLPGYEARGAAAVMVPHRDVVAAALTIMVPRMVTHLRVRSQRSCGGCGA